MLTECPCRYCDKRNATCHGSCEEYKTWAKECEKLRNKLHEKSVIEFTSRSDRTKRGGRRL